MSNKIDNIVFNFAILVSMFLFSSIKVPNKQ